MREVGPFPMSCYIHVDHLKLLHETSAKVAPYSSQVQQDDTELLTIGGIE